MSKKQRHNRFANRSSGAQQAASSASTKVADRKEAEVASRQDIDGERLDQERREDIRGVMISVVNGRLLLPNASVAEVLSYADPEPVDNTPDWLMGRIRWRGWQLPLVSFSKLADLGGEQAQLGNKVVVLRALGGDPKFPYFAMLTQGFPRLVTVTHEGLIESEQPESLPTCVLSQVMHNEDVAMLPDILGLETMIGEALSEAA